MRDLASFSASNSTCVAADAIAIRRLASWFCSPWGSLAYVFYRWSERRRFMEQVKGDRITPDELKHKLEAGDPMTIIDLRHPLGPCSRSTDLARCFADSPDDLEARHNEIARDGEIVLFCT